MNVRACFISDAKRLRSRVKETMLEEMKSAKLKRVSKQIGCRRRAQKQMVLSIHNRPCTKLMALTLLSVLLILRFFLDLTVNNRHEKERTPTNIW